MTSLVAIWTWASFLSIPVQFPTMERITLTLTLYMESAKIICFAYGTHSVGIGFYLFIVAKEKSLLKAVVK